MKKIFVIMMIVAMTTVSAHASLRQVRTDARFLTDRMAYELDLNNQQYEDVFEVNSDFLYKISFVMQRVVYGYNDAIEQYYSYLDQRNRELCYILNSDQYSNFCDKDYFFRPVYADYRGWYYRVYHVYPNRNFFYYNMPSNYYYSIGSHYGRNYYSDRYSHARYNGEISIHRYRNYDNYRRSDFGVNTRDRGNSRPNNYDNRYNNNRTNDPRYQHRYNNNNITVINSTPSTFQNDRNNNRHRNNRGNNNGRNTGIGNGATVGGRNTGIGSGATVNGQNNTGIGNGATVGGTGIGSGVRVNDGSNGRAIGE